jgi:hypothetical protein
LQSGSLIDQGSAVAELLGSHDRAPAPKHRRDGLASPTRIRPRDHDRPSATAGARKAAADARSVQLPGGSATGEANGGTSGGLPAHAAVARATLAAAIVSWPGLTAHLSAGPLGQIGVNDGRGGMAGRRSVHRSAGRNCSRGNAAAA